jgi:hypothetical protein
MGLRVAKNAASVVIAEATIKLRLNVPYNDF